MQEKKRSLWMIMTTLIKKDQTATPEEIQSINSWMLVRWLSHNRFTVPIADVLNKYSLPKEIEYKFCDLYCQLTNIYGQVKFIQYKNEKLPKDYQSILDAISFKYKVNNEIAKDYYKMMDQDNKNEIEDLVTIYKTNKLIK